MLPEGLTNRDLRETVAPLMGLPVADYHRNRTTCDLRRLRLRGLVERIPHTRRYRVTEDGVRTALCYHRTHVRVMKPVIAVSFDPVARHTSRLRRVIDAFDNDIDRLWGAVNSLPETQPDCKFHLRSRGLPLSLQAQPAADLLPHPVETA